MIRKSGEQRKFTRSEGVEIQVLAEPPEMYDAGRLYAKITIAPGASIAGHMHIDEMESFYVAKGTCRMEDNGEVVYLEEGDVMITPCNESHSVRNESDTPAELIALIISCKQGVPGSGRNLE